MTQEHYRRDRYQAVLFAPDGAWVVDHESPTKEETIAKLCDQGSRWYFYPYAFLTTANRKGRNYTSDLQRVITEESLLPELNGISIRAMARFLNSKDEDWHMAMMS